VVLSGRGSTFRALHDAVLAGTIRGNVCGVFSDKPDAYGLEIARERSLPTFALSPRGFADRPAFDAAFGDLVAASQPDWILLAGYMRILTPEFVQRWEGRMVNIHPSLLPKYTGLHTHERAMAAGDSHAGCTVHLVTADLDEGPVLGQIPVAILPGDTPGSLAARVLFAEHQLYARCLADLVTRETDPEWLTAQVRERAMTLPAAEESLSHGMACFGITKGKKFAWVPTSHHADGRTALLVKISGLDEQEQLIESDPHRFFRPAYFGEGWIGIRLDLGDVDWDDIGEWLRRSWLAVAPRKLAAMMEF
jgi:formyltetrahydrofolate-dependent phosphoribosylglycinamide formyltransferase